ncbi:hypothetical protein [Aequorivita flava]|uniref:ATP-binding protein n=2 Tax=Aequorivita flava TaxID=3114371 RepID=A0AB35YYC7_9FLAO
MKKLKPKYKRYLQIRSRRQMKNKKRNGNPRSLRQSTSGLIPRNHTLSFIDVPTPIVFKLQYEHCEEVISYINKIKGIGRSGRHMNIIMDDIIDIGEGAISMLLSVMEELVREGIIFTGTKPKQPIPRGILEKSGFFKFVKGKIDESNSTTKNTILNTGDNQTPQSELAEEIIKSMETVWGQKGRSPSIYSCVFEMMRNACDHAFKNENQIRWHFALSHSEIDNLVKFSFVDNGKGIIRTFTEGILKNFLNLFNDNLDIVETAFTNGIASRTGLSWRGKGLPTIYENYDDGHLNNLVVISNNVYIDFDRKIRHKLKNSFSGTYYYWKVDQSCTKECFEIKN